MCFDRVTIWLGEPRHKHVSPAAPHLIHEMLVKCNHYENSIVQCIKAPGKLSHFFRKTPTLHGKAVCKNVVQDQVRIRDFCPTCKQRLKDDPFALTKLKEENENNRPPSPRSPHVFNTDDPIPSASYYSRRTHTEPATNKDNRKEFSRPATAQPPTRTAKTFTFPFRRVPRTSRSSMNQQSRPETATTSSSSSRPASSSRSASPGRPTSTNATSQPPAASAAYLARKEWQNMVTRFPIVHPSTSFPSLL